MGETTREDAGAEGVAALGLLAEMSRDFAVSLDARATIRRAIGRIADYVGAESGSLFLLEESGGALVCEACTGEPDITGVRIPAGQGIVGRVVATGVPEMVWDAQRDPRFYADVDRSTGFLTRSLICAPLKAQDRRLGAVELVNRRGGDKRFRRSDLLLLETLGSAAALAIENARLAERLAEQERVRRELELAAEIQRSLLPGEPPPGFPVAGANRPARTVSGDFYDFFQAPGGGIAFAIGDVSGKGINAALLMAKTASLYRCLGRRGEPPGRLLGALNRELAEGATRGMFVTMVAGLLDPESGRLRLANAGHEPALLQEPAGPLRRLPAAAPPLGIAAELVPEDGSGEMEVDAAGSSLYLFTDGLTEGRGARGHPLGIEAVEKRIEEARGLSPADRVAHLLAALGPGPLHDDVTVLVVDADGIGPGG